MEIKIMAFRLVYTSKNVSVVGLGSIRFFFDTKNLKGERLEDVNETIRSTMEGLTIT